MFKVALLSAGAAAVAARIEFPTMIGRGLLQMTFEELPFPKGDVQHEVATSGSVDVDGTAYPIKCAPPRLHSVKLEFFSFLLFHQVSPRILYYHLSCLQRFHRVPVVACFATPGVQVGAGGHQSAALCWEWRGNEANP